MIVSHKNKFIFFACGKTGTTSIEKILQPYHDAKELDLRVGYELYQLRKKYHRPFNPKHALPSLVKKHMSTDEWDSYFKFVFVRNPWDWIIANFFYNFRFLGQFVEEFNNEHVDALWYLMKLHNQSLVSENYFQHSFVYENGMQIVDYVGKFESIQEHFNNICRKISIPQHQLPHENQTKHIDYRELYSPAAKALVSSRFEQDINLFGYQF